jgi:hypothetical protein
VTKIILLDPWFFPLNDKIFNTKIDCPVLILANELFIHQKDIYERNTRFIKLHKPEYLCWKEGHHLHQTDIGYVYGNSLNKVEKSHLMNKMLKP